jgi:type IV pilus assembly protein PilM
MSAQSAGLEIGRVFISGGAARVPGLAEALGARLGVRTQVSNPLERIAIRPELMQSLPIDELSPMLMLPVGLALRHSA